MSLFYLRSLQSKVALLTKCSHFIRLIPLEATQYLKTNGQLLTKHSLRLSSHSAINNIFVQNEEIEKTTFADVGPIEIDSSFVQLLKSLPDFDQTNSTNLSGIAPRSSDDFLLMNGKRHYSTIENQPKAGNQSKPAGSSLDDEEVPKSKTAQLKKLFAVYGSFAIAFHIAISLVSVGICYLLVSSGVDIVGIFAKLGIETSAIVGGASTMVVAYAIHKLILPLRASITLISVPILIRYLRRVGYFKK